MVSADALGTLYPSVVAQGKQRFLSSSSGVFYRSHRAESGHQSVSDVEGGNVPGQGEKRNPVDNVVVAIAGNMVAAPLVAEGIKALIGQDWKPGLIQLGIGLPLAVAALTFAYWKDSVRGWKERIVAFAWFTAAVIIAWVCFYTITPWQSISGIPANISEVVTSAVRAAMPKPPPTANEIASEVMKLADQEKGNASADLVPRADLQHAEELLRQANDKAAALASEMRGEQSPSTKKSKWLGFDDARRWVLMKSIRPASSLMKSVRAR